ncbi:class I SAM-dependent methyltransferase [Bradyrhizobium sp. LTSP885]|uniref:class I SAM-dependent methyltransferase n=1 Tax=Bradyrhizobium sp. LTSP885 TaxID=1619232 RepID=UPI0018CE3B90|nr:class I SAM-dependent methyltransferase [Bradyrhizobium sp. LTSP885]
MDSSRQKQHYTAIHDAYEAHYYDAPSMEYRSRFIYRWLFAGVDFNNATVADLACGSGYNSLALKQRFDRVRTVGFDISEPACASYRRTTSGDAHVVDLMRPVAVSESYDAAIVVGGLHHCVVDLAQTLRNIAAMVKPGGYFLMMEPSADFALNVVRDRWYAADKYFDAPTEEALSHDAILKQAEPYFEGKAVRYFGGLAYFLILNSLIMRVPLAAKPILWPIVKPVEVAFGNIPLPSMYPCFLAKWKRTSVPITAGSVA